MKINEKNVIFFHSCAFLFGLGDPYDTMVFTIRKPLSHFWHFSCFSWQMLRNPTKNGNPEKHRKLMLAGTQNDPKMSQISMSFPPKTPNCAKNEAFLTVMFFCDFWNVFFHVSLNLGCQNGSQAKNNFNHFRLFSRHFSAIFRFQGFFSDFGWFPMPKTTKNNQKA